MKSEIIDIPHLDPHFIAQVKALLSFGQQVTGLDPTDFIVQGTEETLKPDVIIKFGTPGLHDKGIPHFLDLCFGLGMAVVRHQYNMNIFEIIMKKFKQFKAAQYSGAIHFRHDKVDQDGGVFVSAAQGINLDERILAACHGVHIVALLTHAICNGLQGRAVIIDNDQRHPGFWLGSRGGSASAGSISQIEFEVNLVPGTGRVRDMSAFGRVKTLVEAS